MLRNMNSNELSYIEEGTFTSIERPGSVSL